MIQPSHSRSSGSLVCLRCVQPYFPSQVNSSFWWFAFMHLENLKHCFYVAIFLSSEKCSLSLSSLFRIVPGAFLTTKVTVMLLDILKPDHNEGVTICLCSCQQTMIATASGEPLSQLKFRQPLLPNISSPFRTIEWFIQTAF